MKYYCTYFDQHYIVQGLALCESLKNQTNSFHLFILCLDSTVLRILNKFDLENITLIDLEEFESRDQPLLLAKTNRSKIEYFFTCTPSLPLYIFKLYPFVDLITYLDADLFFMEDPSPLFDEMGDSSIAIIGHRFPPSLRRRQVLGIYNVGWLTFRKDPHGLSCLQWWRERCLEWCYDRIEEGRFADQKYLDDWPARFERVRVLIHPGANLAPWNLDSYDLQQLQGRIYVHGHPLIFFHFHGLKKLTSWLYNSRLDDYRTSLSDPARRFIYRAYIDELRKIEQQFLREPDFHPNEGRIRGLHLGPSPKWSEYIVHWLRKIRNVLRNIRGIMRMQYLVVFKNETY